MEYLVPIWIIFDPNTSGRGGYALVDLWIVWIGLCALPKL